MTDCQHIIGSPVNTNYGKMHIHRSANKEIKAKVLSVNENQCSTMTDLVQAIK